MEQLDALFLRVLSVSAGCSAALAPLLLLTPRIQKRVAARSLYVLFLLLALRLMLPLEVKLPAPAVTVPAPDFTVSVPVREPRPVASAPAAEPNLQSPAVQTNPAVTAAPAVRPVPVLYIFAAVWAAGAAACALWSVARYAAVRRRLLKNSVSAMERDIQLLDRLRRELGIKRTVSLRVSIAASSPLALGLFRPMILLPGREAPELVLRHELTHIRRWDIAYKLALSLACWVNWFNPLVWLMDRAAGRNLELCCDDEAVRGLPDGARRQYGNMLLDAARTARPIPFSTCFSGGKVQMKERLVNLFANKKNSAALVCLVLAAALLAGGLVACEKASGSEIAVSPENQARRALFQAYFDQNYAEDNASVVLADLTGDGLEEMLVITMDPLGEEPFPLRRGMTADQLTLGTIDYCTVRNDEVVVLIRRGTDVSSSHAGWGYAYLVPNPAGEGYAILDFRPATGMGMAGYVYGVCTLGAEEFVTVEQEELYFLLEREMLMGDASDDATPEEVQHLLDRAEAYRDSGVPLLVYQESFGVNDEREFAYLDTPPAEVFSGAITMDIPTLRKHVVSEGGPLSFMLPEPWPDTPEQALDWLESSLEYYGDGFVFRLPTYEGTWDVQIFGWARMEDSGEPVPVRYLEDEEWIAGRVYAFETEGAWFDELTLWAQATAPDGTSEGRTIDLLKLMEEYAWKSLVDVGYVPTDIPAPPEAVAESYLETVARRMYLYEEGSELKYTAYWGGISQVVSYIPDREYVLYEGHTLSQYEIMDRLIYKQDGANALKYLWMAERGPMEDVSISYTVERVQTRGDSALVDITEDIQFRCQGQTELSQSTIRYQVDLVQCEGKWLVADVNHRGHSMEWCDSKDEESACALTGLPHSIKWFGFWFGTAAGHEELLGKVLNGNNSKLPCGCLAGRVLEDGTIELVCDLVNGEMCRMTVRLLADDSVEILAVSPWAA